LYGAYGDPPYIPPPPLPPPDPNNYGGLLVFDISNPTNLVAVSYYQTNAWGSDVAVSGSNAFLVGSSPRFQAFDVSNPANLIKVAGYDTPGQAISVAALGNYALVADGSQGLQILWVGPPQPVRLTAQRSGGQVRLSWPVSADGFLLQSAASLMAPQWQVMPVTPQVQGESYTLTVPASGTSSFFRLWHP
jgi:hypothetical protein